MTLKEFFRDINSKTDYDNIAVAQKDAQGNPTELRYYKNGKRVLTVYVTYDADGDFNSLHAKPEHEEEPKDEKKRFYG